MKRCHIISALLAGIGICLLAQEVADAQPGLSGHHDPIAPVILGVTGILFFAILGRFAARRLNQPSVLGEVLVGILIGVLGNALGFELIVVLREGPAVFDVISLALTGEPLDSAAREVLGDPAAESLLAVLQGSSGGIYLQVAHTVDVFSPPS